MMGNLYGNPHSGSDPAMLSGNQIDDIRLRALAFFGADPKHFDLVFTASATAAIKLVGEGFHDLAASNPRAPSFWYGYHKDAHTSLVGVRELTNGNHYCFINDDEVEDFLNGQVGPTGRTHNSEGLPALFAYPGQSNMTGRRLPLGWAKRLRHSKLPSHQNTYTLLDAAALAMTSQLDLSDPDTAPDFTAVSFYKIFGFPDLGALIIRMDSGHIMKWRKYFGGGTVRLPSFPSATRLECPYLARDIASIPGTRRLTFLKINGLTVIHEATVQRRDHTLHDGLEDGTLPFHNIIALGCALKVHYRLYGSMTSISQHTCFLTYRLYHGMKRLTHYNGNPLFTIYHDPASSAFGDATTQGAAIAFNVMKADGTYIGHAEVEHKANDHGIYLRSGGLCNAGGVASYLHMEPWQFKRAWSAGHRCGDHHVELINGKPMGVVRASLGAMTTIADVDALLSFFKEVFVQNFDEAMAVVKAEELTHHNSSLQRSDSGFESIEGVPHTTRFYVPGQINARRMINSPGLRGHAQAREPRAYTPRSISVYDHRPTSAASHVSRHSLGAITLRPPPVSYSPHSQQRPDTARNVMPGETLRYSGMYNRDYSMDREIHPLIPDVNQQENDSKSQKGRKKFKFWKCKKESPPNQDQ